MSFNDTKITKTVKKTRIRENVDSNIINSQSIFNEVDEMKDVEISDTNHHHTEEKPIKIQSQIKSNYKYLIFIRNIFP